MKYHYLLALALILLLAPVAHAQNDDFDTGDSGYDNAWNSTGLGQSINQTGGNSINNSSVNSINGATGNSINSQSSGGTLTPGQQSTSGGTLTPGQQSPTTNLSNGTTQGGLINPLSAGTNLQTLLSDVLALVVQIGTVVVVLMLVYVGFLFVTARGDTGQLTTARTALLYTVIGALILLGAQAIASGIAATTAALSSGT